MSVSEGKTGFSGDLIMEVKKGKVKAPLSWKLKNNLRPSFISGFIGKHVANAGGCRVRFSLQEVAGGIRLNDSGS